jgi:CarD family transcriptional regulator
MQFSVGDKVVHPGIGAGKVIGTKHQEMGGGVKHYYVIDIPSRNSTIYVPVLKAEELGVRPVMSRGKVSRVFRTLASKPQPLPRDHGERQEEIQQRLKADRSIAVAEAVRDLAALDVASPLTGNDKELLARGRGLLAGEIALATETLEDDVNELIGEALAAGQRDRTQNSR